MHAKLLYEAWKGDKYTESIANLFIKPEDINMLHSKKVYISEIKKLSKNIIIHLKKDSINFIIECHDYFPLSLVEGFKSGFYSIEIFNGQNQLKIELKQEEKITNLIYCLRARIIDETLDCTTFIRGGYII